MAESRYEPASFSEFMPVAGDSMRVSPDVQMQRDKVRLSLLQQEQADNPNDPFLPRVIADTTSKIEGGDPFAVPGRSNRGSRIAGEIKERKARTSKAVYEPMTFGDQPAPAGVTYEPMFPDQPAVSPTKVVDPINDTVRELGRSIWEGLTVHTPASIAAAYQGMDVSDEGISGSLIAKSKELQAARAKEPGGDLPSAIPGIKVKDLRDLGQNLGFSLTAMGAGLAAGIPAGIMGGLVAPGVGTVAGYTAGMSAAGKAGYNMDVNQVTRQLREAANDQSMETSGRKLTSEEWRAKLESMKGEIQKHGLYEAVPEAAGAGAGFAILTTAAKVFGKGVIARFTTKLAALYGEELLTETVTQIGQQAAETRMGLQPGEKERSFTSAEDWAKSAKEIAPQIFLLTTLTAGAGKAAHLAYQAGQKRAQAPTETPPAPGESTVPPPADQPAPEAPGAVEAGPPAVSGQDLPILYPGSPTYTSGEGGPPTGGGAGGGTPNAPSPYTAIDADGNKYRPFVSGAITYEGEMFSPFHPDRIYAPDTPADPNMLPIDAPRGTITPIDQARVDVQTLKDGFDLGLPADSQRMINAKLVSIYGENPAVRHVIESPELFGSIGEAMLRAAPTVERVRGAIAQNERQRDVTDDILGAVDEITRIRKEGGSVAETLAEGVSHDLSYEGQQLAEFLDDNADNPQALAEFLENYLHEVERATGVPSEVRGRAFDIIQERRAAKEKEEAKRAAEVKKRAFERAESGARKEKSATSLAARQEATDQRVLTEIAVAKAAGSGLNTGHLTAIELAFQNALKKRGKKNGNDKDGGGVQGGPAGGAGPRPGQGPAGRGEGQVPKPGGAGDQGNARSVRPAGDQEGAQAGVDQGAHEAASSPKNEKPEPSTPQILAGNAELGHVKVGGLDISIENPEGSTREDKANVPPKWKRKIKNAHYGYVKGVPARSPDKDYVDIFVKPGTAANHDGPVFVVDQLNQVRKFDEPKVMVGYADQKEAKAAYLSNYAPGWENRIEDITPMTMAEFKAKLQDENAFKQPQRTRVERIKAETAKPNPEQRSSKPVAESQALPPEGSDAGVAPGQAAALPDVPRGTVDAEPPPKEWTEKQRANYERLARKAAARKKVDAVHDPIEVAAVKLGGLTPDNRKDITREDKGNFRVPFAGFLFNPKGHSLGDMATMLDQYGYMSPEAMADVDGGVQELRDKLGESLDADNTRDKHYSTHHEPIAQAEMQAQREEDALAEEMDRQAQGAGGAIELDVTPEDLAEVGEPVNAENVVDAELIAAAIEQVGEAEVERLAMQHENDSEFHAAVLQLAKEKADANQQANAQPGQGGEEGGSAAPGGEAEARPALPVPAAQQGVLTPTHPNVVVRDIRGFQAQKLGDLIEPYDGTEDGAREAAKRIEDRMRNEFPEASNIQSRIGATDENGKPKWAISPNLKHVSPVDSREGAYIWGDIGALEQPAAEYNAEGVKVDPDDLSKGVLSRMDLRLKSLGYDSRGADDVRNMLKTRIAPDGVITHPDWIAAYQAAIEGARKTRERNDAKAAAREKATHVDFVRIRELGLTEDWREAGYITERGSLIDLSGKREGGQRGERSYDHREAGGTPGMQEYMALGNIRIDANSGSIDISKEPTQEQYRRLMELIEMKGGEVTVDMEDGLGEPRMSGEYLDYYLKPRRSFSREYPEKTKAARVIADIRTFFAGGEPRDLGVAAFRQNRANYNQQGFQLEGETEAEIRTREAAAKAKEKAEMNTAQKAEAALKALREKKEIAERSKTTEFTLETTQAVDKKRQAEIDKKAAEDRLAGQNSLFQTRSGYDTPWYYSELAMAIEASPMKQGTAKAWQDYIKSRVGKGVKPDEIEATGINEWLATQEGRVTKEQVAAFMEQGGVQVTETVLRDSLSPADLVDGMQLNLTKFSDYQLPGSVPGSYRELVLTLPLKKMGAEESAEQLYENFIRKGGDPAWTALSGARQAEIIRTMPPQAENVSKEPTFVSGHFPNAGNYLAHTRVNDRILPDGRKVLFVEEIQSDRAQKGRTEGFNVPATIEFRDVRGGVDAYLNGERMGRWDTRAQAEADLRDHPNYKQSIHGIASAPFVTKTDSWTALVLKRLLRYAAEGGYDSIAWTRGDQQVERYTSALRKAVDVIEWKKTPEGVQIIGYKGEANARQREAGIEGRVKVVDTTEKESALSDAIGKSMADKIRNDPNQTGTIDGDGITVSDTGMAGYYDRIVPKVANEISKKLGGGNVEPLDMAAPRFEVKRDQLTGLWYYVDDAGAGESNFKTREAAQAAAAKDNAAETTGIGEQQSLAITPAMREKIMAGQALFQRKPVYNPNQGELVYDGTETRPGTNATQRREGIAALTALWGFGHRGAAGRAEYGRTQTSLQSTLLGSAIWKGFKERGTAELLGQQAGSAEELAILAQILRDPRWETMRVIFTKAGKIVGHTAWTTRKAGGVAFAPEGGTSKDMPSEALQKRIELLRVEMEGLEADGYYLIHNHPNGISAPSDPDVVITKWVAEDLEGFLGHVVIDHDEYSVINRGGNVAHYTLPTTPKPTPELPHELLGKTLLTGKAVSEAAKALSDGRPGYAVLIATNAKGDIQALAEVPASALVGGKDPIARGRAIVRINKFMEGTGSAAGAFIVAENPERFDWLINKGWVTDAVGFEGGLARRSYTSAPKPGAEPRRGARRVFSAEQMVWPKPGYAVDQTQTPEFKKWFGDSKVVDEKGEPLVVYHGTGADITVFDSKKAPHGRDKNRAGAFWFTTAPEVAGVFAGTQRGEKVAGIQLGHSNILPAYLSIQNPFVDTYGKYAKGGGLTRAEIADLEAEGYDGIHWPQAAIDLPDTTDQGPVKGYYRDRFGNSWADSERGYPDQWGVFRPEQIKSVFNRGTFDPSDPNILEQNKPGYSVAIEQARQSGYRATAQKVVDRIDQALNPLGTLPEQGKYLARRGLAQGTIDKSDTAVKDMAAVLGKATEGDAKLVYEYLTTAGAQPGRIQDQAIRLEAVRLKEAINRIGDELVDHGLLSEESREAYRDAYLPRLYLKHLLSESDWKALGAGKKPSDMGYLKKRKDIPEEVRRVLLGEITDPGFLAGVALAKPVRDMALLDWLGDISQNKNWVLPNSVLPFTSTVTGKTRQVTPFWLKEEAAGLRRRARHYDTEDAARARSEADAMDEAADEALEDIQGEHSDYKQIPNTARYGLLRGLYVRTEIYNDLMGVADALPTDPGWFQSVFGYGGIGTRATGVWKGMKVAMNPPSQVRNFISNAIATQLFGGVPLRKVPQRIYEAIHEIRNGGKHYQISKDYGVASSTFATQEVYRMKTELLDLEMKTRGLTPMGKMHRLAALLFNKSSDFYQLSETIFKTAVIIDAMERQGMGKEQAVALAQHALFDYSLIQKSARYARSAPIGIPFLTYSLKVLPRLIETALLHPQRFLPWIGLFYGFPMAAAAMLDVDDDDLDKLKMALPEWLQEKGHALILPWKDEYGRFQAADLGYYMPWGNWADLAGDLKKGELGAAVSTAGIFSGPVTSIIVAIKTGKDPFTGYDIWNKGDPPQRQLASILNYMWSMSAPPFITDRGILSPTGLMGKEYGGKLVQAISGTTNKMGEPRATMTQAMLYMGGFNLKGMTPEYTRAQNLMKMRRELGEVKLALRYKLYDQSLSPQRKFELVQEYTEELKRRAAKITSYMKASEIAPSLRQ